MKKSQLVGKGPDFLALAKIESLFAEVRQCKESQNTVAARKSERRIAKLVAQIANRSPNTNFHAEALHMHSLVLCCLADISKRKNISIALRTAAHNAEALSLSIDIELASKRVAPAEEGEIDAAAEVDSTQRRKPTPVKKLSREIDEIYVKIVQAMPGMQALRLHDSDDPNLNFLIDMQKLNAFGTANDVMAGVIAKFEVLGFICNHTYNVGVNTFDWLKMTAPSDWLKRLLIPIAAPKNI